MSRLTNEVDKDFLSAADSIAAPGAASTAITADPPVQAFRVAPFFAAIGLLGVCALCFVFAGPLRKRIARSRVLLRFAEVGRGLSAGSESDPRIGHAVMDVEDAPVRAHSGTALMAGTSLSPAAQPAASGPVDTGYSTFRLDVEEDTMLGEWRAQRDAWQKSLRTPGGSLKT
tara:strand:- start:945 stop:1460 length:516 start_codon:yes stop_codon:yes gene_type:complete